MPHEEALKHTLGVNAAFKCRKATNNPYGLVIAPCFSDSKNAL